MTVALAIVDRDYDRYIAEISRFPLLDREQELALARRLRDQNDVGAAHQLVVSNLRFVIKIANEYRGYGLRLLDLVQEGNIGLMQAVKKFDPERGYRLISYAVWWIRAHIHDFILKSWSLVKLGAGRVKRHLFFKLRSERSRAVQEAMQGQEEYSTAALAKRLGVSETDVSDMEIRMGARDFSLDAPLSADADDDHLSMLRSPEPSPEDTINALEERRLLNTALDNTQDGFNEKERFILDHRLLSDEPQTLEQVGEHYGFSRERARQIESRVLGKLRAALPQPELLPAGQI